MKAPLLLLFLYFITFTGYSQAGFSKEITDCAAPEIMEQLFKSNPGAKTREAELNKKILQFNNDPFKLSKPQSTIVLPVVVHIIHNNGFENISDAQVLQGIQHLNEAFANTGFYDPANGVNTNIQFCLAQRDPSGNLTNGITRDVSTYTNMGGSTYYSDDLNVKNINRWNPQCYINIWLVNNIPGSVAGYAYMPAAHGMDVDGILQEVQYFGVSPQYDIVIIHEMGHYLGLHHTFNDGCQNNNCLTDGDMVCDTPPDNSLGFTSCTASVNSCSTDALSGFTSDQDDLKEDYMDYGNWDCMNVFTQGQAERMNWHITNVRSSLLNCLSCVTPCNNPVTAVFSSPVQTADAGTSITFTNNSVNGSAYSWFVNNVPVANTFNYSHLFNVQGTYIVRLLVTSSDPSLCESREFADTILITCPVVASITPAYNGVTQQGNSITFTHQSVNATSMQWYFDNIPVSTAPSYVATFNATGVHNIKLKAMSAVCADSFQVYYLVNGNYQSPENLSFSRHYERNVNTTEDFLTESGILTPEGDIVIAGYYNSTKNWITKYTNTGEVIWSKRYENGGLSRIRAAINTNDNNYVFAGDRYLDGIHVIKTDPNGNVLWQASPFAINNYSQHRFNDIIQLPDSSYLISSTQIVSFFPQVSRAYLFKLSKDGALIWSRILSNNITEGGKMTLQGNGVWMAGNVFNSFFNNWAGLMLKIDPATGNTLFATMFETEMAVPIKFLDIATINDKLVVNGYRTDPVTNQPSAQILSIFGTALPFMGMNVKRIINESANPLYSTMHVNAAKEIIIAMNDRVNGKLYVTKYDTALQLLQGRKYIQNTGFVNISKVHQLPQGNLILTGNRGAQHALMIRTLPDLSTPGCNDSAFVPVSISSGAVTSNFGINQMQLTVTGSGSGSEPAVAENYTVLTHFICNYFPLAPTCDTALVQNLYNISSGEISGSIGTVSSSCKRSNGNYLIASVSFSKNTVLTETDKNGVVISAWQFTGADKLVEVKVTPDGGYVLLAVKQDAGEFYVIKYTSSHIQQWAKEYNIDLWNNAKGTHIYPLSDNGYFIAAAQYLIRINAAGDVLFGKRHFGFNATWVSSLIEDGTDVVYSMIGDMALYRINKITGAEVWSKQIGGDNMIRVGNGFLLTMPFTDTTGYAIKVNNAGDLVSAHEIYIPGSGFTDHRLSNNGTAGFVIQANKQLYNEFFNNKLFLASFDTAMTPVSGGKTTSDFITNSRDVFVDNGRIVTTGDMRNPATSLVNQYLLLYKTNPGGIGDNCVFTPVQPEVSPVTINQWGPADLNQQDVTITVTNVSQPALPFYVFTHRECISGNCLPPTICDTANCNTYTLDAPVKVCNLEDTISISLTKGANCSLIPTWNITGTAGHQVISQTDTLIKIKFSTPGTFYLHAKSFTACKIFEDSIQFQVFDNPDSLNIGPDRQICANSIATLHATPGFASYLWQDYSTDTSYTAYTAGLYHVTATDYCGNVFKDSVIITNAQQVPFNLADDIITLCKNDSVTITAPAGFTQYHWAPDYNINNVNSPVIKVWPDEDTMYIVTTVVNENCVVMDSIRITVKEVEAIQLPADTSFCAGGSVILNAGTGFSSYVWNTGAATSSIVAATAGIYMVSAQDASGCFARDTMQVLNVHPLPTVNLGNSSTLCTNESLTLTAGTGSDLYLWQDNSTLPALNVSSSGLYWVRVTNSNGCKASDSIMITTADTPRLFIPATVGVCLPDGDFVKASSSFADYLWSTGATADSILIKQPGSYWLQVTNTAGCKGTIPFVVYDKQCRSQVLFPNSFTPDGNNLNDVFRAIVFGTPSKFLLTIYNRYGQKVFETNDHTKGWDGAFKGTKQNTGVFVWICTYTFDSFLPQTDKGTVMLVR